MKAVIRTSLLIALHAATLARAEPGRTGGSTRHSVPVTGVQASVRPSSTFVPVGQPVWVHFSLENTSGAAVTLTVPGAEPKIPDPEDGLPLSHIFSSENGTGVVVWTETGRQWERPVGYRHGTEAPILLLAPHGSVGRSLDLREYYPALRSPGQFKIAWKPYSGAIPEVVALLHVTTKKNVEIITDDGTLTIQLFYDEAPLNVSNFLDLVKTSFYRGLSFHRIEPGYMIQGGCPKGDGTGSRSDAKRVPPEFTTRPLDRGTVSMALVDGDPDSASSQFFICASRQTAWDGNYTAIGELVGDASFATLDKLMATPVDDQGRPRKTVYMRSVRTVDAPDIGTHPDRTMSP